MMSSRPTVWRMATRSSRLRPARNCATSASERSRDNSASIPAMFCALPSKKLVLEQRSEDRLVDFGRAVGGRERRNILFRAMLHLLGDAGGMQAERGIELLAREVELARDQERVAQRLDGLRGRELRPLVEPFWYEE